MVGSAPGLSDVVLDGVTSLRYERPTTLLAVTPLSQAVLPDVNKSVSFWFWVAADEAAVSLKAPVITSTPPICEPKVDGAMAAGVSLVPSGVIQVPSSILLAPRSSLLAPRSWLLPPPSLPLSPASEEEGGGGA